MRLRLRPVSAERAKACCAAHTLAALSHAFGCSQAFAHTIYVCLLHFPTLSHCRFAVNRWALVSKGSGYELVAQERVANLSDGLFGLARPAGAP